ncbi:MAG: 16S rRNA (cytosine(1402)-N(4))-methyltransferase RsmH [Gammaproteobacteria bacterium]|nr:16S rRNA (cytosine(1402)-N(4))-methyltransferase RsmH [Gammaproteobacteria bacterium]
MKVDEYEHAPVLVSEVEQGLNIQADGIYVDCTFGRGGHSKVILRNLNDKGKLFVFDRDPEAVKIARQLASHDSRVTAVHSAFSKFSDYLKSENLTGLVNGILFDLGVSSPQIDDPKRGFSFVLSGELDMRMDPTSGIAAREWLNQSEESDISDVLRKFGEEKFSRRIARAIVEHRQIKPISTTQELSEIITDAVPFPDKHKHPATRTFQAIRILINDELEELKTGISEAYNLLAEHGRLVVISFHSLEDRIVKRFFRELSKNDPYPQDLPVTADRIKPELKIVGKLIKPSDRECDLNPRARSAKLRIAEKLVT